MAGGWQGARAGRGGQSSCSWGSGQVCSRLLSLWTRHREASPSAHSSEGITGQLLQKLLPALLRTPTRPHSSELGDSALGVAPAVMEGPCPPWRWAVEATRQLGGGLDAFVDGGRVALGCPGFYGKLGLDTWG